MSSLVLRLAFDCRRTNGRQVLFTLRILVPALALKRLAMVVSEISALGGDQIQSMYGIQTSLALQILDVQNL